MKTANLERVAGIEPASSAWKAEVLPLNYTRGACSSRKMVEGEGFEPSKSKTSDLQSDPFGRSGTPPERGRHFQLLPSYCQAFSHLNLEVSSFDSSFRFNHLSGVPCEAGAILSS